MTLMKGRKFVSYFFKKEVFHSSSDLPKNLPTDAQKDQQEQNVDKPQTKLEKSTNPNFNQHLGKLSTEVDSKCTSKFFIFFYSAPQQNLAWCKVKQFNFQSWSLRMTKFTKVPKAGSSTWVENFLLLANETKESIASMVSCYCPAFLANS